MIAESHPTTCPLDVFRETGDQEVFAALVREHLPLVYSAALRLSRDASLAEEIAQTVFIKLATLKKPLPAGITLTVWLHRVTRSLSIDMLRSETRRRLRETAAAGDAALAGMAPEEDSGSFPWEQICPVIDEVIAELSAADRDLILSRFFAGSSQAAMARKLDVSEDALRMRLKRALGKMRQLLERRGIVTTASLLALCLPAQAANAIPASLEPLVLSSVSAALAPPPAFTLPQLCSLLPEVRRRALLHAATMAVVVFAGAAAWFHQPRSANDAPSASSRPAALLPSDKLPAAPSPAVPPTGADPLEADPERATASKPPSLPPWSTPPLPEDFEMRHPGRQLEVVLKISPGLQPPLLS